MSLRIIRADCREANPAYIELIRRRCAQPSLFEEDDAA